MAFFIEPNRFLVFFSDPRAAITPSRLKALLAERGITTSSDDGPFALRWCDGPQMMVSIVRGPTARILASRLAGGPSEREEPFASFDGYIEVSFDDLDEMLDEINTLIEVQATFETEINGLIYRSWNQSWSSDD